MSLDHNCDRDDNWEVPINRGFLDSETPQIRGEPPPEYSEDDAYEVPMVPLESVGGGAAAPVPEYTKVCRAIPGCSEALGSPQMVGLM